VLRLEEKIENDCVCNDSILLCSEYLTKEALKGFGNFKIVGQVIRTMKYGDKFVLLAKTETVV